MLESTPKSVSSDGTFRVWVLGDSDLADPTAPSAAELTSAPSVTYSMTTDGYNRTSDQATETDPRLTLRDVPESPGAVTNSLELTYVHGSDDDVLDPLIVEGELAYVVERRAVNNAEEVAAGQKVDIIAGVWGKPRKNAPTTNGKWTKTAKLFVSSVIEDVELVA